MGFTAAGMASERAGIGGARAASCARSRDRHPRSDTTAARGRRLLTGDQVYRAYGPRLRHGGAGVCASRSTPNGVVASTASPRDISRASSAPAGLPRARAEVDLQRSSSTTAGDQRPSPDDVILTRRLWQAGLVVGIELLDHIVVGDGRFVSMRADGALGLDGGARLPQDRGSGSVHEGWP